MTNLPIHDFLGLCLNHTEAAKQFAESGSPSLASIPTDCRLLANAIIDTWHQDKILLEALTYMRYVRRRLTVKLTIPSEEALYNRCKNCNTHVPGDYPMLARNIADNRKQLAISIAEELKNVVSDHLDAGATMRVLEKATQLHEASQQSPPKEAAVADFSLPANQLDKLPKQIRNLASYLATSTNGTIDARHIMLAIAGYAALLGKRAKFPNWGVDYYCNLAIAILSASGTGKSNLKSILANLLRKHAIEVSDLTTATVEGIVCQYAVTVSGTAPDKEAKRKVAREESAKQAGVTIMTDELLALTGSMLREQEAAKYARMLCQLLDNNTISTLTKRDGLAIWHDQCVNVIGLSQVDSFDGALRTPMFRESGLSGRIIPVNHTMAKWDMSIVSGNVDADAEQMMEAGRFNIHFGDGDKLKDGIAQIEAVAQEQVPVVMDDWKQIKSKILIYGAKVAAILAILEHLSNTPPVPYDPFREEVPTIINASRWVSVGMLLVHSCHASNLYYVGVVGMQHQKIMQTLELKGASSRRDLCKFTGWKSYEVEQLLRDLVDSGEIVKVPTARTIRYQLR